MSITTAEYQKRVAACAIYQSTWLKQGTNTVSAYIELAKYAAQQRLDMTNVQWRAFKLDMSWDSAFASKLIKVGEADWDGSTVDKLPVNRYVLAYISKLDKSSRAKIIHKFGNLNLFKQCDIFNEVNTIIPPPIPSNRLSLKPAIKSIKYLSTLLHTIRKRKVDPLQEQMFRNMLSTLRPQINAYLATP